MLTIPSGDKKADHLCIDPNGRTFPMVSQPDGSYKDMAEQTCLIDGTELEGRLIEAYTRILETAQTPDFTLIITGYTQFFNEVMDLCDSKSLALPIFRPPLVKAIRAWFNTLVRGINAVIDHTIEVVNKRYVDKHIQYFSIDGLFDTHRLCDADPTTRNENKQWRNDAWFYTLETDDVADLGYVDLSDCPTKGTKEDTVFGSACMLLWQIYTNQEELGTGTPARGSPLADVLGFFKSFHSTPNNKRLM
ncbi:hypothetical protein BJY00DRAFT_313738 [Aspergillus carlsbadensis]|nr:hypothetical protein BJY00DRAFT_313738 [Aspergillus carlsbadensis]